MSPSSPCRRGAIDLCLFDETRDVEVERIRLGHRTGDVFHAHVEGLTEGRRYGLRAHGAFEPEKGCVSNASNCWSILTR